ncbi:MAG: hypothetical protein JWN00_3390 [Actinomycetia bacterium]|nr:hypothetical protein [Actinomycetes bacterium]
MNGPIVIGSEPSEVGLPAAMEVLACGGTALGRPRCGGARTTSTTTTSAVITGDDPLRIYQTFITVVLLCRGLVE